MLGASGGVIRRVDDQGASPQGSGWKAEAEADQVEAGDGEGRISRWPGPRAAARGKSRDAGKRKCMSARRAQSGRLSAPRGRTLDVQRSRA